MVAYERAGVMHPVHWLLLTMPAFQAQSNPAPPNAAADSRPWYQAYEEGLSAMSRREWRLAIDRLTAARDNALRRANTRPGRRVYFQGDRVDVFNPDYYIGVAHLNLREYQQADEAFERVPSDLRDATFERQARTAKVELAALTTPTPVASSTTTPVALAFYTPVATPEGEIPLASPTAISTGRPARTPTPATTPQSADPRPAIAAFFRGEYGRAEAELAALAARPNASSRTLVYLALARAALVSTGERPPESLAQRSGLDVASLLRQLDSDALFDADRRLVSPRLLRLLKAGS